MEADWEFEVGGDAPVIEARWAGFVDLRVTKAAAWDLPEAAQLPALAEALARLNGAESPVWTSKCDFWPQLEASDFDPIELDAPPASAATAMGCYIDLLPRSEGQWELPEQAEGACRRICGQLYALPQRCCRADLVIRRAFIGQYPAKAKKPDMGITAYLTACGASLHDAAGTLQAALAAFADAICIQSTIE